MPGFYKLRVPAGDQSVKKIEAMGQRIMERLKGFADQPLPMGTSSVSKKFQINGAQSDVFDADKLADDLERRNQLSAPSTD